MLPTLPAAASPAESARSARVSEASWRSAARTTVDPSALPTAAGSSSARDPAVINHAGKTEKTSAASSPEKADKAEAEQIRKLKARDAEVRAHEQAHAATGGAFAGAPSYEFQRGPDGHNYAVGGEVPIDVSAIAGDPRATIRKMQQVQRAALAPPDPSGADRAIASTASAMILAARRELITEDPQGKTASDAPRDAHRATSQSQAHAALGGEATQPGAAGVASTQRPDPSAGATFHASERRSAGAAAYKTSSTARGVLDLVS